MRTVEVDKNSIGMTPGDEAAILANCRVKIQLAMPRTPADEYHKVHSSDAYAAQLSADLQAIRTQQ